MTDPWRYRCPNGHTSGSWQRNQDGLVVCDQCRRNPDIDQHVHPFLVDARTGRMSTERLAV